MTTDEVGDLEAITQRWRIKDRETGWYTAKELMPYLGGRSQENTRRRLLALVEAGDFEKQQARLENGHESTVFRLIRK